MLEFRPYLQRESHSHIIICHGRPNLTHRTPQPLLKVGLGNWLGHASRGRAQHTGGCRP